MLFLVLCVKLVFLEEQLSDYWVSGNSLTSSIENDWKITDKASDRKSVILPIQPIFCWSGCGNFDHLFIITSPPIKATFQKLWLAVKGRTWWIYSQSSAQGRSKQPKVWESSWRTVSILIPFSELLKRGSALKQTLLNCPHLVEFAVTIQLVSLWWHPWGVRIYVQ